MAILLPVGLVAACQAPVQEQDLCQDASRHYEQCTGEYFTPPICTEQEQAFAESLLQLDCNALEQRRTAGRADGAWCNWFGMSCVDDEEIFQGPFCQSNYDCPGDERCVEYHCFAGIESTEMVEILDDLTGTQEVGDSELYTIVDNSDALALWRAMIDSAEHHIHIVSLLIEDNAVGSDIADRLIAAAARGVEVRVIVDDVGQYMYSDMEVLGQLAAAGVQVIAFNPSLEWAGARWRVDINVNQRIHEKVLVVDGVEALTGGRNIGTSYLADGYWRDSDIYVTGAAVAKLQGLFAHDWDQFTTWEKLAGCPQQDNYGGFCPTWNEPSLANDASYFPEPISGGQAAVRVVYSNPREQEPSDGFQTYLAYIRSAQHSIKITNAYFIPPMRLRNHLKAAAERGVQVTVLTNSKRSIDQPKMWYAALNYYEELIRSGVSICEWQSNQTVHAKTLLIDDTVAVVGSFNLDPRSAASNSEALTLFRNSYAVSQLGQAWRADMRRCAYADYDFSYSERFYMKLYRLAEPLL